MSPSTRAVPIGVLLIGALLVIGPRSVAAQVTGGVSSAERAAVLLETARTFEARERWDVAEALYRLIVDSYPNSDAAVVARQRLASPPRAATLGDGRVGLQVWSTLFGAWLGVAVPGALGADTSGPYGVGLLLGAPGGFLAGRSIARATGLTEGQASAVSLGAWWGTWQGFGWQEVFEIGVEQGCSPLVSQVCYPIEDSDEEAFASAIVGGLAGIAAGALLARREITPGTGTAMNFGPLWGSWFGVAFGVLFDLEDDDLLAATLLGGNAGLVATGLLAPGWNVSRSRARMISLAGVLGGLAGAGFDLLLEPDDEKVAIAIPLVGSLVGLGLGIGATRDDDPSSPQGPDGGDAALGGALMRLHGGRLSFGAPLPEPVLVPTPDGERGGWRPALRLGLFRATF